jgi:phosphoribosylformylglycinamidine synthase
MRVAVLIFPGSNCDHDALHAANNVMGWEAVPIWHQSGTLGGADLVILPGGFSYGDYLRAGAIARFSPIMQAVVQHVRGGGLTMGICNGFQILCEAGLLPGTLRINAGQEFRCQYVNLKVQTTDSPFTHGIELGDVLTMPIAHGEGCYFAPPEVLEQLNRDRRVVFRYCDAEGNVTPESNPNGSLENIAGILSEGRNVLGMMPHPERASEDILGCSDGKRIFAALNRQYIGVDW